MEGTKSLETNGSQTVKSNDSISDRTIPFPQETSSNRSKESDCPSESLSSSSVSSENVPGTELKVMVAL